MPNYDVKPVNSNCTNNKVTSINPKQSGNAQVNNNLNDTSYQHESNNKYDTVDSESVKPLYGGNKNKKYTIEYENKKEIIYGKNENKLLKDYFKNKKFSKDIIVNIYENNKKDNIKNKKNKYILRNNKINNLCRINY